MNNSNYDGSSFNALDYLPIQEWEFNALEFKPDQYQEWNGVCACGAPSGTGIRCKLGATHETLEVYREIGTD